MKERRTLLFQRMVSLYLHLFVLLNIYRQTHPTLKPNATSPTERACSARNSRCTAVRCCNAHDLRICDSFFVFVPIYSTMSFPGESVTCVVIGRERRTQSQQTEHTARSKTAHNQTAKQHTAKQYTTVRSSSITN